MRAARGHDLWFRPKRWCVGDFPHFSGLIYRTLAVVPAGPLSSRSAQGEMQDVRWNSRLELQVHGAHAHNQHG